MSSWKNNKREYYTFTFIVTFRAAQKVHAWASRQISVTSPQTKFYINETLYIHHVIYLYLFTMTFKVAAYWNKLVFLIWKSIISLFIHVTSSFKVVIYWNRIVSWFENLIDHSLSFSWFESLIDRSLFSWFKIYYICY